MPDVVLAVGGDSLLGGFDQGGTDPIFLVVVAAWSAAVAFALSACLLRWFAPPDWDPTGRRWLAATAAGLVALVATGLSANLDRGFLGGVITLFACFVATAALPVVLGLAYLLGPVRRRRRGKPAHPGDPLGA